MSTLYEKGFCVLKKHFANSALEACREAFWPILLRRLESHADEPNRGPYRHFLRQCHSSLLDVPLPGSLHQQVHVDYQRPLFAEVSDLPLPTYMLVVSFGLSEIVPAPGPIEIAPGTHRMPREAALRSVESGTIALEPVPLDPGDVLIRHPWVLHRGTPNTTPTPRPLVSIRYVRRWYPDYSREGNAIPRAVRQSLTPEQQAMTRFPIDLK